MGGARHGCRPGQPQGKSTDTANGTRGQRPIVQGDRDRGRGARRIRACIKGARKLLAVSTFPKFRRLDKYQRARCASRCDRQRPGSSRCAVCAACRLSGAEYTLPSRGGGVIRWQHAAPAWRAAFFALNIASFRALPFLSPSLALLRLRVVPVQMRRNHLPRCP